MKIFPDLNNPKLTRKVKALDENMETKNLDVIEETPLTLFLNNQEIVTMMTINDHPKFLALGYLLNQNMINENENIEAIDYEDDIKTVVVRTKKKTNYENKLKKKNFNIRMRARNGFRKYYGKI